MEVMEDIKEVCYVSDKAAVKDNKDFFQYL